MEGTTLDWIAEHAIALMIPLGAIITPLLTLWFKRYLDKRDKMPHSVANAVEKNVKLGIISSSPSLIPVRIVDIS